MRWSIGARPRSSKSRWAAGAVAPSYLACSRTAEVFEHVNDKDKDRGLQCGMTVSSLAHFQVQGGASSARVEARGGGVEDKAMDETAWFHSATPLCL